MSRAEILAFVGGVGGGAAGYGLLRKHGDAAALAGMTAGYLAGVLGAHAIEQRGLGALGVAPSLSEAESWYYLDSWAYFYGSWTHAGSKGPMLTTAFSTTVSEDILAFDAKKNNPRYVLVRRFRWDGTKWVRETLQGDWSRKYSFWLS